MDGMNMEETTRASTPPYVNPGELKLLDWFAGCALIGLCACEQIKYPDIVADAFRFAREMLEVRAAHVPREESSP
jgi:hypothetical protein